jgi:hypothetical protein
MRKRFTMSNQPIYKAYLLASLVIVASFVWTAPISAEETVPSIVPHRGKVVIFASEKLGRSWIGSHFNTVPEGKPSYNQCEISLGNTLEAMGFENPKGDLTRDERAKAKRLRTVFIRYKDMSTMANDTAVKASNIVDGGAEAVVLCTVEVGPREKKWRRRSKIESCAEVRCKAITTSDSKRLATHSIKRCAKGPEETGASVEAIRSVCSEAGTGLGQKIIEGERI